MKVYGERGGKSRRFNIYIRLKLLASHFDRYPLHQAGSRDGLDVA
jgi:hypothetical protein